MATSKIQVIFEEANFGTQTFEVSNEYPLIICELKRKIYEYTRVPPIQQRLSFQGQPDYFSLPLKVLCNKRQRTPSMNIPVYGYNQDIYNFAVDPKDHVLDLKFLLAKTLNDMPEHIKLTLNSRILQDNQTLETSGCLRKGSMIQFWLEYPSNIKDHSTIHRTLPKLIDIDPDFPTIAASLRRMGRTKPKDLHLGKRSYCDNGTRGKYHWINFEQINKRVSNIASGFRKLGLQPKNTRIGICSNNRIEWVLCDYAAQTQSFISVPLYDTLAKNAIEYIINHADIILVVCNKDTLAEIIKAKDQCPCLKYIILMDDDKPDQEWINKYSKSGYTHRLSDIEKLGESNIVNDVLPLPDDVASIYYTSGTTGNPKGVILTNRGIMSCVNSWYIRSPPQYLSSNNDSILSYLPLAHIYERLVEIMALRVGARIGYYSGDINLLVDDIQMLKPSFFAGVPRVYQKIQDRVLNTVESSNFIRRFLFNQAFEAKASALQQGLKPSSFWETLVFRKVKQKFGGEIKACTSGSAPLSINTANFLKICVADLIGEGYGLTETCAGGTTTSLHDIMYGHVGTPIGCIEIKLVSVPDMNYLITDQPEPRGEIWMKGTCIFKGYFKEPDKTREVLNEEGWFATGDIGKWRPDGKLQIIDRKKNIFKLAQGEYIRPEYIENVYKMSSFIANVFVYGDSNETFLVAIVVPNFESLSEWAKNNGLSQIAKDYETLIKNPKVINVIRHDMEKIATREQLTGFEKIKRFLLVSEDFTIENGLLTSSMKLKRHEAKLKYINEIKQLYQQVATSKM